MADEIQLAVAICEIIQATDVPVPITLANHTVEQAASIIGAVVERCDREGVEINEVCIDSELALELGLTHGMELPHGCRPIVHVENGLGRRVLFKREKTTN